MISRRKFLMASGGVVGALTLWLLWPEAAKLPLSRKGEKETEYQGVWIHLNENNHLRFFSPSSEIGQGILTGFSQIVANFLDFPLQNIQVVHAPANEDLYGNPEIMGMQMTGGSRSIAGFYEPLRMAMLQARHMLLMAAAQEWKVDVSTLQTQLGEIINPVNNETKTYGSLAQAASRQEIPRRPLEKKWEKTMGEKQPRIDLWDKVTGKTVYGVDVKLPGMKLGSIRHYPYFTQHKATIRNENAILAMPGVERIIPTGRGLVVLASTTWHAIQACKAMEFDVKAGEKFSQIDDDSINKQLIAALDAEGRGEPQGEIQHTAEYAFPYLAHQTLEPQTCTAWVKSDGDVEIWIPTQGQSPVAKKVMEVTGISQDKLSLHTSFAGGGFGRRGEVDMVEPAITASKVSGAPVKLIWSREEDTRNDYYRSATRARVQVSLDKQGKPRHWYQQFSTTPLFTRFAGPIPKWLDWDPIIIEGANELPYAHDKFRYDIGLIEGPVPVGFWRSVAHTYSAFVLETTVDTLAHLAKQDAWQYRYDLLEDKPRFRRVMEKLKALSHWGEGLAEGRVHGMAIHQSFDSIVGEVLEVGKENGLPRVFRAYAVVDCGIAINPELIKQQIEGGLIMGLSAALGEQVNIKNGEAQQSNFHDYPILRNAMSPRSISVEVIAEGDKIGGIGEVGVPPAAPALANAWFKLSGHRVTSLPINRSDS